MTLEEWKARYGLRPVHENWPAAFHVDDLPSQALKDLFHLSDYAYSGRAAGVIYLWRKNVSTANEQVSA